MIVGRGVFVVFVRRGFIEFVGVVSSVCGFGFRVVFVSRFLYAFSVFGELIWYSICYMVFRFRGYGGDIVRFFFRYVFC